MGRSVWDAVTCTLAMLGLSVGLVWWRAQILRPEPAPKPEPAASVEERYPMPAAVAETSALSPTLLEAMVRANPFSPERRKLQEPVTESAPAAAVPATPRFVYKGRVVMGANQRAVVEEQSAKKTYFLQVGQEVAGFKVLDIDESRVLLSDQHTQEQLTISLTQPDRERGGSVER